MPFQALPIALRDNTGDPLSKLAWIFIVHHARIDDAPNGMAYSAFETRELASFCQASEAEVVEAVDRLVRLGLVERVYWKGWGPEAGGADEAFADVSLPISQIDDAARRRIKGSPDQLDWLLAKQAYSCVTCGSQDDHGKWHLDHILPRSVGGADIERNCQVICATCNSRKGARVHWVDFIGGRARG
ncbi:HNH endonuclease [Brevundimonas viscosa]|uniref:HNH endonuclease n=1 Tax=Brevundimonas viscosa TaxID=871741 RepID=A0A1I6PQP4_9CAUL|nr:HNH endonuclease signature motif containing protein [Brevundimonas viscosa]SFS42527.1 HNH endonuclease [Brevundimonas viscosa]